MRDEKAAMDDYDEPNILFFIGINPQKYDMDTMWTSRLLELIQEPEEQDDVAEAATFVEFDRIPEYFETLETWPMTTNLRCGSCHRNFKTRPAAVVTNVMNTGAQIATKLRTPVLTCSFDCSVHFINVRFKGERRRWEEMHRMLRLLYQRMTGLIVAELNEAPDPLEMNLWGGPMTINEFIKQLRHTLPECAPAI